MRLRSAMLILMIASLIALGDLYAQTGAAKGKGRVRGSVTDTQGNPVPDVTIKFSSERLQTEFEAKTNDKGAFTITGVAGGSWNVDFMKEGYKTRKISTQISELSYNKPMEVQLEKATPQAAAQQPKQEIPGMALVEEGNTLRASKDFAGAIAKYEAALAANPSLAEVYGDIARIHVEQNKPAEAIEAYKKLLAVKPENQDAKMELAALLLQQKNVDEAKALLGGSDLATISNPYTLYNLGVGFYNAGQADEAIKYWEKAVSLDAKLTDAWLQLGFAYYSVQNKDKAREALQKVIEIEPGSENAKSAQELLSSIQ